MLGDTWESVKPNFAALFALSVVVFIWSVLSPIWLPLVAWVVSFLLPVFWFVCEVLLVLASLLIFGLVLAVISLLMGGTIPSSRGF
ncbi:MAG: hypothetical protein WCC22_09470 [Terriglobales bacterium]